ncbi:E3 ubiquitin-protein ligase MARCH2 [Papilio machaon]|uniref:E3 ubiquitin-protein ligase MARCH2 n=1 Tax=Papilio machaon TaxID=76193 RepID=A0A194QQX4_PAPMA|nr:E3 ubiquitin-protein ligase MARCH2 [Papilio machaon]
MRSILAYYADVMSAAARGAGCALGCSGRGDCMNGTCLCEIRYAGDECAGPNLPYHACIGGVFLLVAFICAVQLTICVVTEYRRLKAPTFLRACKVTTQKMLYLVAFLASLIRGAYFVSPSAFQEGWATSLLSAYYPLLMSGSSLIVCFWAENFYQHVFNGCYAVLLFIVVIFFLIYGVEVYFKLRGEFLKETKVCTIISPRPGPSSADDDDVQDTLVTKQGIQTDLADRDGSVDLRSVDLSQLHQSRLGLVSQALMLILIAGFLASETLSEFWKTKVPVVSRNWHDVVFRLAEIGVALWFPCVLWNSMAPERLWLLNPRRLLARQLDDARLADLLAHHHDAKNVETDSLVGSVGSARDCWICYDGSRNEPLIRPCRCTGDVSAVHHDCLRRWLIESATTPDGLKCKVCNTPYIVQKTNRVEWERGFTCAHWTQTALAVASVCGAGAVAWLLIQLYPSPVVRVLCAGAALLVCYVAIRYLSTNTVIAYQRAKVSSLRIVTEPLAESQVNDQTQLCTISKTVTVEIASKAVLEQALKGDVKN